MKPIILKQHEVIHLRDHGSVIAWRVVKPQPPEGLTFRGFIRESTFLKDEGKALFTDQFPCASQAFRVRCPYGRTGEARWVKETFRFDGIDPKIALSQQDMSEGVYRADLIGDRMIDDCPWLPSTRMPRWVSRFTVTLDVGLKRIQEVTEEESKMSGVQPTDFTGYEHPDNPTMSAGAHRNGFIEANPGSWDRNEFHWKITCTLKK